MPFSQESQPQGSTQTNPSASPSKIPWIVRPAELNDKEKVNALLWSSYSTLLPQNYTEEILQRALPKITTAQEVLLTCGTWYVVEHPQSRQLVGCGGFTLQSPMTMTNTQNKDDDDDDGHDAGKTKLSMEVPHLRHFATDPQFARQGIATAIWKRTWHDLCTHFDAKSGLQQGPPTMEVFSSLTAEPFYASLGFRTIQEVTIPLGDECMFPALLMKLDSP